MFFPQPMNHRKTTTRCRAMRHGGAGGGGGLKLYEPKMGYVAAKLTKPQARIRIFLSARFGWKKAELNPYQHSRSRVHNRFPVQTSALKQDNTSSSEQLINCPTSCCTSTPQQSVAERRGLRRSRAALFGVKVLCRQRQGFLKHNFD